MRHPRYQSRYQSEVRSDDSIRRALAISADVRGGLLSYIRYESDTKPDSVFWRFARRAVYGVR